MVARIFHPWLLDEDATETPRTPATHPDRAPVGEAERSPALAPDP